jgi:hypothetical protein
MIKDQISKLISEQNSTQANVQLHREEKEYAEKHGFITDGVSTIEKDANSRFLGAYLERSIKETEELIAEEGQDFLSQPIEYLKKHKNEFIYMESQWLDLIGIDAISFEVDDVFGTYDVMLGLKLKKKYQSSIQGFLNQELQGDEAKYDLMFSPEDGLWNLNFDLNSVNGFNEKMSFNEAFQLMYSLMFKLVVRVEDGE